MVVVGAGGHALEVLDVLQESSVPNDLYFFDEINVHRMNFKGVKILKSVDELRCIFPDQFTFVIAVGAPLLRKKLYHQMVALGGSLQVLRSSTAAVSQYSSGVYFDVMKNCFIGPDASIGLGTLINTGAQVHHEVSIGEFVEVSPRAVLLGKAGVGAYSRIGANATVLPSIKIGTNTIIAAGAVVTKNIPDNCMVAGVPAVIKKQLPELTL